MSYKISPIPRGMFSDSTTQSIANTSNAQAITFNTDELKYGVTHSTSTNTSRIYVDTPGSWLVMISAIVSSVESAKHIDIWFRKNGTDIARSNTKLEIVQNAESTLAVSQIFELAKDDYIECMMAGDHTAVQILAVGTQTTPTRPASPSIILTINKISR